MNTIAIRLFAPVMVVSAAVMCGACSAPVAEDPDSNAAELSRFDGTLGLEKVDHAAFGEALSPTAKSAGIAQWRVGVAGTDLVVDGVGAKGASGFQFRISQQKGNTVIACNTGNVLILDAKGNVMKMTLTPREQKLFGAAAADLDDSRAPGMKVAYLSWGGLWHAVHAGFACAAAAVEGGANVVADIDCAVAAGEVLDDARGEKGK
jgi:hypothetical protein